MTRNLLCVSVILSCFLTLQPFSVKASPIFSDGGDKPTPFRYTFRVERVEFGDAQSDEDYDLGDYPYYIDYPGCEYYDEYSFEDETNEEQDEDDDDYEYPSDDEDEEYDYYSYSYEDQEDEYTIDYEQEEEEYPSDYEEEEDGNDEEGISTEEITTEGYPGDDNEIDSDNDDDNYENYDDDEEDNDDDDIDDDDDDDFDLSDYIEEYIDEYYSDDYSDEFANGQVKTVPHVRKSHSHRHPSLHGKKHPLGYNKIPFPTWKPAVRRAPLPAHPRKNLGKRPQTRHHHQHDVNKDMKN